MKISRTVFLISIIFLGNIFSTQAQHLFDKVPNEIEFEHKVISSVFSHNPGTAVNIKFSEQFHITGILKSNNKIYNNLQSVLIECTNYKNLKFFISKRVNQDLSISYVGRMISRDAEDGFEVSETKSGKSKLKKISLKEMIVE
jgi:hypothetical protein